MERAQGWGIETKSHAGYGERGKGAMLDMERGEGAMLNMEGGGEGGSHAGYWERGEGREHVSPVPAPTCTCILSDKHSLASCKPN